MNEASWNHLRQGLELLNSCLLRDVNQRTQKNKQLDMLQGLVLSEQEVLDILKTPVASTNPEPLNLDAAESPSNTTLAQLTSVFQLSRTEELCLLLCLAPEIDNRYSRVFAFLQDDITRRQPTVELALRLFCPDFPDSLEQRKSFSSGSSLFRNRLIQWASPGEKQNPLPQRALKLDDRIAAYLLQTPEVDECLVNWVRIIFPTDQAPACSVPQHTIDRTLCLVEDSFSGNGPYLRPLIHLYGKSGSGRRSLACLSSRQVGLPLVVADIRKLPASEFLEVDVLWRLCREALLLPAVILIENFDDLLQDGRQRELNALLEAAHYFAPVTFLSGTKSWKPQGSTQFFVSLECPVPDATTRIDFWRHHLDRVSQGFGHNEIVELSSKFSFTEGQIHQTVQSTEHRAFWENRLSSPITPEQINQTARTIATPSLGGLARKVETTFEWSDIVLPEGQVLQLKEIASHAKRSQTVFEEWGFNRKFSYGRGIAALFEGQSGTGKTMAASIIGRELGLDVYQIDLSSVVSKYIGETEKNLSRIFEEAQDSNAILFFDEADALFGKRSEVKDAHDRYSNIETAYLLQRMEEVSSGIVILATNMKQNLDEAFVRRMRFIINFPFPSDEDRERIWQKAFPSNAPLSNDVDFRWLARKLKITGGNIKNISLRAAFLAIERQGVIGMDCLVDAAKRENEKIGKIDALIEYRGRESARDSLAVAEVA
jgi:hypothetical protein